MPTKGSSAPTIKSVLGAALCRRQFLDGAQKFAVGGVTATALLHMLKPNYAGAIQVPPDDKRIRAETQTV
jgi:carboxymethylenebutenolidase